jgi:hypothetical protein
VESNLVRDSKNEKDILSLMCVEKISGPFTFEVSGWVVRKSVSMKLSNEES